MPSHCQTVGGIGWIFGHLIDGTQAELVRVPYADTSLYAVPSGVSDEQAIFLADSLPTGYEVGVLAGGVRPGDTVAVVGAGAVGLSAVLTTGLWGASKVIAIDSNKFRLEKALEFGATDVVEVGPGTVGDVIGLTDGLGVDVAIEAVGYPETLLTAASLVRPGGTIANVGVHGTPVELPMQDMWISNVTLTMGLVDTVSIPTLLKMVASGRIPAEKMGTHRFTFDQIDEAYDVFSQRGGQPRAQGRHHALSGSAHSGAVTRPLRVTAPSCVTGRFSRFSPRPRRGPWPRSSRTPSPAPSPGPSPRPSRVPSSRTGSPTGSWT